MNNLNNQEHKDLNVCIKIDLWFLVYNLNIIIIQKIISIINLYI